MAVRSKFILDVKAKSLSDTQLSIKHYREHIKVNRTCHNMRLLLALNRAIILTFISQVPVRSEQIGNTRVARNLLERNDIIPKDDLKPEFRVNHEIETWKERDQVIRW